LGPKNGTLASSQWGIKRIAAIIAGVVGLVASGFAVYNELQTRIADPLTVSAEQFSNGACGPGQIVPVPPERLGPIPPVYDPSTPEDGRENWVRERGGVNAKSTNVEVIVQGATSEAVILTDLTVNVVRRTEPMAGTNISEPCGDAFFARYFDVDLDLSPPSVGPSVDAREEVEFGSEPPNPINFPYTVSSSNPERFILRAETETCYCEWTATLHWIAGDDRGETVIDDNGSPFVVSAVSNAPQYANYYGGPLLPVGGP